MLKIILILVFLPSLFLFFISEKPETVSNSSPTPSPTKTPANEKQEGVDNIILDKETVFIICPAPITRCTEDKLNVKVKTLSKSAEKNNLNYYYTVSGGQIIGQGVDVIWNLSGIRPGKYTIMASVGKDNIICGKTVTKTIELEECPECDFPCECPTITVSGPTKPIKAGDSFIVTANVNGGSQDSVEYKWKITDGEIISGQNAAQIIIKNDPNKKDFNLTATVEINGLCENCPTEDSETFKIE